MRKRMKFSFDYGSEGGKENEVLFDHKNEI